MLLPRRRPEPKPQHRLRQVWMFRRLILGITILLVGILRFLPSQQPIPPIKSGSKHDFPPLVMRGGDPYLRALMRTISASETNDSQPYSLVYGGHHIQDLSHHPALCVKIVDGPNQGKCSTAAGRYQLLDTTWVELAQHYHPLPAKFLFWESYSFEPEYQDQIVYAWLSDAQVWGMNISQMLRQGKFEQVQHRLSNTWTSLGYGIESNSMTGQLPKIYQKMLQEELQASS